MRQCQQHKSSMYDLVRIKEDGTTECCGAYTSIFQDDGTEYCKCCFAAATRSW